MKLIVRAAFVVACGSVVFAQEREVPKDSTRVSVTGCTKGRTFIATPRSEPEPVRSDVEPGRRFRLSGPKQVLDEIRKQEGMLVEVTGLVRKSQLSPAAGVTLGKGRVRIGGGPMNRDPTQSDPRRDPMYNEVVMDVESWRPLPESCPKR
jgi:hypothetical protein